MKHPIFKGIGTALVTPMTPDGKIDYAAIERLVQRQVEAEIDALVVCATTGEAPTLGDDEHIDIVRFVVNLVKGRTPVIAGTGSNYTDHAVEMSIRARDVGADAIMCVTPYYNKCAQRGLVASFTKIADATELPMIVYNVPSRTGVNILPATYEALAEHPRIVGIKEANGNISSVVDTMARCRDKIDLYSGNDDQIVPLLAMGGSGCISVLSNLLPAETSRMCHLVLEGNVPEAMELQKKYLALTNALFCEVNPIPVKAAMAAMGYCENYLRLPLVPMEEANEAKLLDCMRKAGINC